MSRYCFLILLSMIQGEISLAQSMADSLYQAKNYPVAGYYYLESARHTEFKALQSGNYYNAACCYALSGKPDSAMTLLRLAISAGFKNSMQLKGDNASGHYIPCLNGRKWSPASKRYPWAPMTLNGPGL